MKKFLSRILLLLGIVLILLIGGSIVATWLFGNRIGQQIVDAVNEQITTELTVNRFQISLLRSFPNVSANLVGIEVKDTKGGALLTADNLSCTLGLIALIRADYEIKTVKLSNCVVILLE